MGPGRGSPGPRPSTRRVPPPCASTWRAAHSPGGEPYARVSDGTRGGQGALSAATGREGAGPAERVAGFDHQHVVHAHFGIPRRHQQQVVLRSKLPPPRGQELLRSPARQPRCRPPAHAARAHARTHARTTATMAAPHRTRARLRTLSATRKARVCTRPGRTLTAEMPSVGGSASSDCAVAIASPATAKYLTLKIICPALG